jgi:hypothetical protein
MSVAVRVRDACGWVEQDGTVFVAALPDGPPLVLEGSSVLVWAAVVEGGTVDEVVARVAVAAGESAGAVAPGVTAFVDGLVAAGALERVEPFLGAAQGD